MAPAADPRMDFEGIVEAVSEVLCARTSAADAPARVAALLDACRPEASRALLELSFRRALARTPAETDAAPALLDLSVHLQELELVEASLPFALVEEWAEGLCVWQLARILDYLELRAAKLTANLSSSKGKGLVLLRLCNELIRRLSKSQDAPLCGRVLLFISKVFPSGERSGVNLRGDINVENTTPFDASPPAADLAADARQEHDFYRSFWRLHFFIYHPVQAMMTENWPVVRRSLEEILGCFERGRSLGGADRGGSGSGRRERAFYPKFLSDRRLFRLQLVDPRFRQTILVEISIFLQHLLAFGAQEEHKPPSAKSLPVSLLNAEQEGWIVDFNRRLMGLVAAGGGGGARTLLRQLRWILRCERNWMAWKSSSCPSFERDPCPALVLPATGRRVFYDTRRLDDPGNLGSAELSRLWRGAAAGGEQADLTRRYAVPGRALTARSLRPRLADFLAPLMEQLDAESGIEEAYRQSRDEVACGVRGLTAQIFRWRAQRLLLHDDLGTDAFGKCRTPDALDALCLRLLGAAGAVGQMEEAGERPRSAPNGPTDTDMEAVEATGAAAAAAAPAATVPAIDAAIYSST